jgi:hypothetical protein
VVAHGIFNAELLGAFLARRAPGQDPIHWKSGGMTNTGWIEVGHHDEEYFDEEETSKEVGLSKPGEGTSNPSSTEPSGGPDLKRTGDKPYLKIKILNTNVTTHLDNVKRQGGGIGSTAYDSSQKGIKDFFGGGGWLDGEEDGNTAEGDDDGSDEADYTVEDRVEHEENGQEKDRTFDKARL